MKLICTAIIDGPCITKGATAWGQNVEEHASLKKEISEKCASVRSPELQNHRLSMRIDFHLQKQRLKLSDLDNMAKVVLDAVFGDEGGLKDRMADRVVWRLELCKVDDHEKELTEIWGFDEGAIL